jgi:hypothetical protein
MIRIDNATAVAVRPTIDAAGTPGWWTNGDPGVPTPATIIAADFLNDVQAIIEAVFTAASVTPTKGPGGDNDLLTAINTLANAAVPPDVLVGHLKRTAPGIVQLQPRSGTKVYCSIDNVVLENTGSISFDMASDFDGSEGASEAVYFYLRDQSGTLDPQISATAPDPPGGTKPGYKSGDTTRRCVGSEWNNASQDFVEQSWGPGGEVTFHARDSDHEHALAHTQAGWGSQAVNLPKSASRMRYLWFIDGTNDDAALAASDATTDPTVGGKIIGTNAAEILHAYSGDGSSNPSTCSPGSIPIADIASPAFKFTTYGGAVTENDVAIIGYTDLFAPR